MSYETLSTPAPYDDTLIAKLLREKKIAREFQERRHDAWNDIYELYRNRVRTNRLTQRQAVNIPLMKETVKTIISKIDDAPAIEWKELSGDDEKQMVLQEIWNHAYDEQNLEGLDIQDKKTVLLNGRSFKKLNPEDGKVCIYALDIFDVVVDPMVDPLDIETARFIIHQNIFKPLREVLADGRYSAEGRDKLKMYRMTDAGMIQSNLNKEEYEKKLERLKAMGVDSANFPLFAAGDVLVNICEHYTKVWNPTKQEFERRVVVYADDAFELMDESLVDLIGVDFYPFVTWSEDVETNDFWSDGIADLVRTPNKILNIWYSQLVENRTLKNFQMHWYDATVQGYVPQTYEPGPGQMLPAPGNPAATIQPVEVSGLDDTLEAIDYITKVVERGSGATAIEKGESQPGVTTLGEVQILVGKAQERAVAMAKFYKRSWQELAMKWYQLMDANAGSSPLKLYKTAKNGTIWPKTVYSTDWRSKAGYKAFARSSSEQEADSLKAVQRFQFILSQFPDNSALKRIAQKRMLEVVDLSAEEIKQVEEEEKKIQQMKEQQAQAEAQLTQAQTVAAGQPTGAPPNPADQGMPPQLGGLMNNLANAVAGPQTALDKLAALKAA